MPLKLAKEAIKNIHCFYIYLLLNVLLCHCKYLKVHNRQEKVNYSKTIKMNF